MSSYQKRILRLTKKIEAYSPKKPKIDPYARKKEENKAASRPVYCTCGKIKCIKFVFNRDFEKTSNCTWKGREQSNSMSTTEKAIEDLSKAKQYIEFEIEHLKGNK